MTRIKTKIDYYNLAKSRGFKWVGGLLPRTVSDKSWWECSKGHRWLVRYNDIRNGLGCPVCSNRVKKVESNYSSLANSRGFVWVSEVLPKDTIIPTWWECKKGHRWSTTYGSIKRGTCCPVCSNCIKKMEKDYHLLAESRGFKWVGEYLPKNVMTKTQWGCKKNHRWETRYNNIKNGSSCPGCASNAIKVKADYIGLAQRRGFVWRGVISPKNIQVKTQWECKNNHTWEATYHDIYKGSNCPKCKNRINGVPVSKPQIKLNNLLCGNLNYPEGRYRIDVAIMRRSQKIAVEYDCQYWHEGNEKYDLKRDGFLISRGWKVIHVKSKLLVPTIKQMKQAIIHVLNKQNVVSVFLEDWNQKDKIIK